MKRATALLILTLFLVASASAQPENDRTRMGLLGPVKTLETGMIEYTLQKNKATAGNRIPIQRIVFNTDGNKTEENSYQNGAFSVGNVYTYDSAGSKTGYEETYALAGTAPSKPRTHQYLTDSRGNITEYAVYESDGTMAIRFIYAYNQAGQKIEEKVIYHNGTAGGRTVHVYDSKGKETETTGYDRDGAVAYKQRVTFDDQGRRIEWLQYVGEVLRYRIFTSYDAKGRVREEETIELNATPGVYVSHSPIPGKIDYVYDDEKRTKEVLTYDSTGALKGRMVYSFDENGSEIKRLEFDANGSSKPQELSWYEKSRLVRHFKGEIFTRIEYDSYGNWIKKTHFLLAQDSREPEAYRAEYRNVTYH